MTLIYQTVCDKCGKRKDNWPGGEYGNDYFYVKMPDETKDAGDKHFCSLPCLKSYLGLEP